MVIHVWFLVSKHESASTAILSLSVCWSRVLTTHFPGESRLCATVGWRNNEHEPLTASLLHCALGQLYAQAASYVYYNLKQEHHTQRMHIHTCACAVGCLRGPFVRSLCKWLQVVLHTMNCFSRMVCRLSPSETLEWASEIDLKKGKHSTGHGILNFLEFALKLCQHSRHSLSLTFSCVSTAVAFAGSSMTG